MDSIEGLDVASVLGECAGISEFLSRFVVEDGDDAIVEGLQMSLQDVDDPNRLIHFVRFRCRAPEELAFHLEARSTPLARCARLWSTQRSALKKKANAPRARRSCGSGIPTGGASSATR
jgi:hypothetical protein